MALDDLKDKAIGKFLDNVHIPLRFTPVLFQSILAGITMDIISKKNPAFKRKIKELEGKVFLFKATDINKDFYMEIRNNRVRVVPNLDKEVNVTMTGKIKVLGEVLFGMEDPDTVFFTRKLEITGETETAILFKNILASI